jgi:hypothetical protein
MNSSQKQKALQHIKEIRAPSVAKGLIAVLAVCHTARAQLTVLDFENLGDSTIVSAQYSGEGVTFSGDPEIQTANISLNQFSFPPHSGNNVLDNVGGDITATLSGPVSLVEGYFTYTEPVTITAYNSLNIEIGSVTSVDSQNWVGNGAGSGGSDLGSPNELISLSDPGIASIVISTPDSPPDGQFTMDDFTFGNPAASSVPDSLGFELIAGVLGFLVVFDNVTRLRLRPRNVH